MQTVIDEEEKRLLTSQNGPADQFIRDFPAKSYYKLAAQYMGYLPEKMLETLIMALELTDAASAEERSLRDLRDAVILYLQPLMLPRVA